MKLSRVSTLCFAAALGCGFAFQALAQEADTQLIATSEPITLAVNEPSTLDNAAPVVTEAATPVVAPAETVKETPAWVLEHQEAVQTARSGNTKKALATLHRLRKEHPEDPTIAYDELAVTGWAGHDADVIKLYNGLGTSEKPVYLLESVGLAYRNTHQPQKALEIYRRGLRLEPGNEQMKAGEILSLTDTGEFDRAIKAAQSDLKANGDRLAVLLAAGNASDTAAEKDKKFSSEVYEALRYYQRAETIAPANPDVIRGITRATNLIGGAQTAREKADKHRKLFSDNEYRRFQGDEAAALVRWGVLEPESDAKRYAETDRAIAHLDGLIAQWKKQGNAAKGDIVRARLDRMVALRDRARMQDVVSEYNSLLADGVTVPNYALSAPADAYLYLREGEKARDLYLKILATEPTNFEARRQLFYAYVECDDYDNAYQTIDALDTDQGVWKRLKGLPIPLPNSYREVADLDSGMARLYGGELADADDRITKIAFAAPGSVRHRKALGDLYYARGWSRAALEQYEVGVKQTEEDKDAGNESGIAMANLDLQHYPAVEAKVADLAKRYPENLDVQHASRAWEIQNMAELRVNAGYAIRPSTSVGGGDGFNVGAEIFSAPIDYNWRVFAGQAYAHEKMPTTEGKISLLTSKVGGEYRNGDFTALAGPTFNAYHSTSRLGGMARAQYELNDYWTLKGEAQSFSDSTPMRALNQGIRADEFNLGATWRQSESRSVDVGASYMGFSDNNSREALNVAYLERLFVSPHWQIDGRVSAATSHNTKDETRPYYNPQNDYLLQAGPRVTQYLYHRYETLWQHSLQFTPGIYSQQHYGSSFAYGLTYEQRLRLTDTFETGLSFGLARQAFDGTYENDANLTFDLVKRF